MCVPYVVDYSTDMKYNKRVYLPNNMTEEEEIEVLNLKKSLMTEIKQYYEIHKGNISMKNLNKNEIRGLKNLKKRSDSILVSQTDKSGRFSVH